MLALEMENISGSKARSVARMASIEIETSDASTVSDSCYSSRRVAGVALHVSEALYDGKIGQMHSLYFEV